MVGLEVGRFLVLFKGGGCRVSPRFYLFVSNNNQENNGVGWVRDFLVWLQGWEDSLDLAEAVKNLVGYVEVCGIGHCRLI